MSGVARRHHTVPRFYLDGFASRRRIGTVRLPGHARFVQSTLNATAQSDFYTIPDAVDGTDRVERVLSKLESDAARVFDKLKDEEWPLDPQSRETLAAFLAVQFLRGPNRRSQIEQMTRLLLQMRIGLGRRETFEDWVSRELGIILTPEEADRAWDEGSQERGPSYTISGEKFAQHLATSLETVYPYFAGRAWVLVRFDRRSLLTCDTPIVLAPDEDISPFSGIGVGSAMAMTVPLTRSIGLILSTHVNDLPDYAYGEVVQGRADWELTPTTRYAKMFNRATVENAREWIFHHPDDSHLVPANLHEPVRSEVASNVTEVLAARSDANEGQRDQASDDQD